MAASYKKLSIISIIFVIAFILGHLAIWKSVTKVLLSSKYDGGDLSRMGYILDSKLLRKNYNDLPRQHFKMEDNTNFRKIDVLTLGDSFSNGGGGGKNRFYQDYIASLNNLEVENIEPFIEINYLTTLSILNNNGYLDRVKPRHIILSSSEKLSLERFAIKVNFDRNMPLEELMTHKRMSYSREKFDVKFINTGNLNYLKYKFLYFFSPNAVFSNTYQAKLTQDLFSVKNSRILLFYKDDVRSIKTATDENIRKLNDNMNRMADILARKGIRFHFMPCVDKYDLYSDYIVNNRYPKSVFFEKLRALPKRYSFIDTKEILQKELQKGEKDVFYPDDSHWNWKASEVIFSHYKILDTQKQIH